MECPDTIVSGNLKVKIKDGSNPWWAAYQVTNAKNPINGMSISVDGGSTWSPMDGPGSPAPDGFWFLKPKSLILNSETKMEKYKIRVESDTGEIVVDMVGVVADSETDAGSNNGCWLCTLRIAFGCCENCKKGQKNKSKSFSKAVCILQPKDIGKHGLAGRRYHFW